jgi:tRNA G18 (ribose-2'-O)-methylase SpoU
MRRQLEQRASGIFVAEGEKVVMRLLESQLPVVSLLLPEPCVSRLEPLLNSRPEHIELFVADKRVLEGLTGFSMYQGVLGVGKVPEQHELGKILESSTKPWLIAVADGISNAENLGALVRNCAAFNVQILIVGGTCCSPFLRRAVRSSMGAIFHLPVVESNNMPATLCELKSRGIRCIAAHPHSEKRTLFEAEFRSDCCVVFGSEGHGLTPEILDICDERAAIPMAQNIDSLNVGSAAAVFFYEANRQRKQSAADAEGK